MSNNEVRIIGGKWRSRKIKFSDHPGLRPTPNRIRETLFNWLSFFIVDSNCLDMFAGSGALGFEALSRGAKSVLMLDKSEKVIDDLKKNAARLHAENLVILKQEFSAKLPPFTDKNFDIVFLDPPFHKNFLGICSQWLESSNCLSKEALIYTESESSLKSINVPINWVLMRQKVAGQVRYSLWKRFLNGNM